MFFDEVSLSFSRNQNFENRLGRIFLRSIRSWKNRKIEKIEKSKNRKIEKSNLISIENFRKSKIRKSKNSKIFNWNQVTFFDFSILDFSIFRKFPMSKKSFVMTSIKCKKKSTESILKFLISRNSWELALQKTCRVHLTNT